MNYIPTGVCARQISFDVENGKVKNVVFYGGCTGNTQGISKLCEGRDIRELITLLEGIKCRNSTSCPDQLSKALKKYLIDNGEKL
ncbi:MAG TPA: TIGR03905 family TSCPD domain-containing protein [Clostridiales bacterium]|nr:TIGR03905 family TSCPD domain-containing protein [Clostridiales bacterium]